MHHDPRKLLAIYAGGVIGALLRVGLAEAASTGPGSSGGVALLLLPGQQKRHREGRGDRASRLGTADQARLAWLNVGLSIVAGLAAVTLGRWLGGGL